MKKEYKKKKIKKIEYFQDLEMIKIGHDGKEKKLNQFISEIPNDEFNSMLNEYLKS
ncbi:MAG: hypothetical protein R6V01_03635 [Thermoplasmatota archaeon]